MCEAPAEAAAYREPRRIPGDGGHAGPGRAAPWSWLGQAADVAWEDIQYEEEAAAVVAAAGALGRRTSFWRRTPTTWSGWRAPWPR
jgi:hypothetical protein